MCADVVEGDKTADAESATFDESDDDSTGSGESDDDISAKKKTRRQARELKDRG